MAAAVQAALYVGQHVWVECWAPPKAGTASAIDPSDRNIMLVQLIHSLLTAHVHALGGYLVPESTDKLLMGAELDQGLLENQVLCMMQNR